MTRIRGLRVGKREPAAMTPEKRKLLLEQARLRLRKQEVKVEFWTPAAGPTKSDGGENG